MELGDDDGDDDAQVTDLDKLHSQQQTEGENKYSTIQKVKIKDIFANIDQRYICKH